MPLYEYHCDDCDSSFELRRPMRDSDAPTECPSCASEHVERRVSLFVSFTTNSGGPSSTSGGGCGCGGACACGAHSRN